MLVQLSAYTERQVDTQPAALAAIKEQPICKLRSGVDTELVDAVKHGEAFESGGFPDQIGPTLNTMVPLIMAPPRYSPEEPLDLTLRPDDDLVQAAQSGHHEAFAELCRRHTKTARRTILAIVRHHEDAEDAMQETLLRAYANLGRFRNACKFSTWMTAIGINAALALLRKRKTRRESDMEPYYPDEPAWDITDPTPDPEHHAAKTQIIFLLGKELRGLPPKIQEVLTSYYVHDHSLQEAANELGISVAAVKSRLVRGRRSLRSTFEQKGLLKSHV